ncbi:hypothetical protein EJ04DRAFT_513167 [Polyplosphaeria fusca]|uniref:SGNH hydrolase-type esterase domain-containing protein n=1 Tax=Polyplosphaeria fusca TaxID=682080 RepID=A0A9P4QVM0_9PLEO|nr:hypothetical protein EJ04DRAFT_513167 [Polyplosphaeria fusca]
MDWTCSRYNLSYPNILHTSYLGNDSNRTHQFLACTGATTTMILDTQVPLLDQDIDLLTISGGGNDIGLTPILNSCIYQFFMAEDTDCESAIEDARAKVHDKSELFRNITKLIDASAPKMNKDHGMIYVTGYAGFFGAEDNICNNVSWSVWKDYEHRVGKEKQYLTLKLRSALNELVRSVNEVLQEATDAAGPNVRFIDYYDLVEINRGRYCESDIQEPSPNRVGLDFYEWATSDIGENSTALRTTGSDVPRGSFEAQIAELINKTLEEYPDLEFEPEFGYLNKTKATQVKAEGIVDDLWNLIWWLLPDNWKRVFHLRPQGHAVIAQMLVDDLEAIAASTTWSNGIEQTEL